MRRSPIRSAALLCLLGSALTAAPPFEPALLHAPNAAQASTPGYSLNWAGYVASEPTATFKFVQANWVVPAVACMGTATRYSSTWTGLGGNVQGDILYQTGTSSDCIKGQPEYHAWWEYVPGVHEQPFADPVAAGDVMRAQVTYYATGWMDIELYDYGPTVGTNYLWSESKSISAAAPSRSAECITERPGHDNGTYTPLANFGTAEFRVSSFMYTCSASDTAGRGVGLALATKPQTPITTTRVIMRDADEKVLAVPSRPSASEDFSVSWRRAS